MADRSVSIMLDSLSIALLVGLIPVVLAVRRGSYRPLLVTMARLNMGVRKRRR